MTRTGKKVLRGYNRLAFGGIQDAVKLLLSENPESYKLEDMDLFNVDVYKRQPGDITDFYAMTDAVNTVVKIPGADHDKYAVSVPGK